MKKLYTSHQMQEILGISRQRLNQLKGLRLTYRKDYIKRSPKKFIYYESALIKLAGKTQMIEKNTRYIFKGRVPVYIGPSK